MHFQISDKMMKRCDIDMRTEYLRRYIWEQKYKVVLIQSLKPLPRYITHSKLQNRQNIGHFKI